MATKYTLVTSSTEEPTWCCYKSEWREMPLGIGFEWGLGKDCDPQYAQVISIKSQDWPRPNTNIVELEAVPHETYDTLVDRRGWKRCFRNELYDIET